VFVETHRPEKAALPVSSGSAGPDMLDRVVALIARNVPNIENVSIGTLIPMFGGNARKAYAFDLEYRRDGRNARLPCVLLTQPAGRQIDTDVAQEFRALRSLDGKGTLAPAVVAVDASGEIIGLPSIVLERLPGVASAPDFLNSPDVASALRLTEHLAAALARLHAVEIDPGMIEPRLEGRSGRQVAQHHVSAWHQTFLAQRMEPLPVMCALFDWLDRNLPDPPRICLVHGDVRPGNFLYVGTELTGLLDWEMAHAGDPIEDLAWVYRPLWSPERFLPAREFVDRYAEISAREVPWATFLYYRIFSELKFATISLTAARAFSSARTLNLRHVDRAATVAPCLKRCLDWIDLHSEEVRRAQANAR
jgi:aminoglycoside phosphotransferase (APT) family kinase protein